MLKPITHTDELADGMDVLMRGDPGGPIVPAKVNICENRSVIPGYTEYYINHNYHPYFGCDICLLPGYKHSWVIISGPIRSCQLFHPNKAAECPFK